MGIEPTLSAWKAEVLPLNYTRLPYLCISSLPKECQGYILVILFRQPKPILFFLAINFQAMVEGEGFEPSKAEPSDLQSDPFDRSGTPPK